MSDVAARFREYARLERKRAAGLTPAELRRWSELKRLLAQRFSPGLSDGQADRRQSLRVPTHLKVEFDSLGEARECLLTNVSRGGVFLRTDHLLPIGTRLVLNLHIAETGAALEVPAEVVSHNVGPRFESERGMGLRFLEMTASAQREIDALYQRSLARAAERAR